MAVKKKSDKGLETEIDKDLKEIKREWRHLIKFGDENRLLFTAFIVLLSAIVIVNAMYIINHNNDTANTVATSTQPNPNTVLTSLQTGATGSFKANISNVTETAKFDPAFTISNDETMLIMDISITNLSSDTQQLIPSTQLYVRSNEGDYSTLHASMYVKNPLPAADVKPGQTVTGEISFAVPKRVSSPLLYVDLGWDKYTPIVFDVLH